jgi:hypothetical protein
MAYSAAPLFLLITPSTETTCLAPDIITWEFQTSGLKYPYIIASAFQE